MNDDDLKFLKSHIDKAPIRICFTDGEEAIVKIVFVSDSEKDIIYDIISTNRQNASGDNSRKSYRAFFKDIKAVSEAA